MDEIGDEIEDGFGESEATWIYEGGDGFGAKNPVRAKSTAAAAFPARDRGRRRL